jgi:hypothetical protein
MAPLTGFQHRGNGIVYAEELVVRFIFVALPEVPIAARARWFVSRSCWWNWQPLQF